MTFLDSREDSLWPRSLVVISWQVLITALRASGIDVQTALDAMMIEPADADHLASATAQGRVLCSVNVGDFYRLHTSYLTQHQAHAGIVLTRQPHYAAGESMRRLLRLMTYLTAAEMHDRGEFLSAWGVTRGEQAP